MKRINLNEMALEPISENEIQELTGGGWIDKLFKGTVAYEVYKGITDNWDEVKARFVEGLNIDKPKK
jgi:hypothetical protein